MSNVPLVRPPCWWVPLFVFALLWPVTCGAATGPQLSGDIDPHRLKVDYHVFPSAINYMRAAIEPHLTEEKAAEDDAWVEWGEAIIRAGQHYDEAKFEESLATLTDIASRLEADSAEWAITQLLSANVSLAQGDLDAAGKFIAQVETKRTDLLPLFQILLKSLDANVKWLKGDVREAAELAAATLREITEGEESDVPSSLVVDLGLLVGHIAADMGELVLTQQMVVNIEQELDVRYASDAVRMAQARLAALKGLLYVEANIPQAAMEPLQGALLAWSDPARRESRNYVRVLLWRARAGLEAEQTGEAINILKEAEQRIREFSRPDPVLLARTYFLTAKVCHAEGQDDAGAKVLDEAIELMVSSPARDSAEHMIMTLALQDLNEVILPANEEIALREGAINALSENDSLRGYEETARLAHFYATRGDADNAAKWHLSVIVDARERIGVSHPIVVDHVDQLSQLYLDSGKPAKAVAVLEEHLRLARDEDPSTLPDAYVRAYGRELMKVYLLRQLAFALEQGGHTEEATSKWKEVVSLLEDPFTGEEIRRHSIAASLYREAKQRLDAEAE